MKHFNYLAFALPVFLLLLAWEYLVSQQKRKQYYQYGNTIANLSVGIAERALDLLVVGLFYRVYAYLHDHFALFTIQQNLFTWVMLFIFTDLVWYWYHRLAHEINILWAVHIVHHQSEDFNFSVSARITLFQSIVRTGFWCVLPLLGFAAPMIAVMLLIHGIYPFFLHTQTVGKLGWLEYVLVTPSHHRVHHASNPQYLDKNYGDVLIIWDKLFGTFAREVQEPVYGLAKPLPSKSFLWQHFHYVLELGWAMKKQPGMRAKFRLLLGNPSLIGGEVRYTLEKKYLKGKPSITLSRVLKSYVTAQVALSLLLLFGLYFLAYWLATPFKLVSILFILLTLVNCGAILEQLDWIFYLEYARLLLMVGTVFHYVSHPAAMGLLGTGLVLSLCYFNTLQRKYLRLVYR